LEDEIVKEISLREEEKKKIKNKEKREKITSKKKLLNKTLKIKNASTTFKLTLTQCSKKIIKQD
jgi:hypothetical protein